MRKITIAAFAGTLALTACSNEADQPPVANDTDVTASDDAMTDTDVAAASVLDASTATAAEIGAIDGITPELADAVVAGQPYDSVAALNEVLMGTLDETQAAAVREKLFVPINLNSASEEEIRLVPGMTDKMVHEFQEYRPYEDMAEFDREIGKYVDEAEVARFRQYVTL